MFFGHTFIQWIGILIGGFLMGVLCGLAPLVAGSKRNRPTLGTIGFFSCILGGLTFGILLAGPLAITFTVIICMVRRSPSSLSPSEAKIDRAIKQMEDRSKRQP